MKKTRLQKILARAGYGSRRGCEEIISSGKVTVNGEIAKLGCVVNSDDEIKIGSKKVEFIDVQTRLFVLNKPTGVICSKKTEGNLKSIYDLIHCFEWFFSDESSLSENVHFKYSDFHLPKDAT